MIWMCYVSSWLSQTHDDICICPMNTYLCVRTTSSYTYRRVRYQRWCDRYICIHMTHIFDVIDTYDTYIYMLIWCMCHMNTNVYTYGTYITSTWCHRYKWHTYWYDTYRRVRYQRCDVYICIHMTHTSHQRRCTHIVVCAMIQVMAHTTCAPWLVSKSLQCAMIHSCIRMCHDSLICHDSPRSYA